MKNEELQDLFPHENYAYLDRERRMRWNNAAFLYATDYYRETLGEEITYDGLIAAVHESKMAAIIALIYGAVRAADHDVDYIRFCNINNNDHLADNILAVIEGISSYLPEPDGVVDDGQDLDESYPDTQGELKKKESSIEPTGDSGTGSEPSWLGFLRRSSGIPPKEP